MYVENIDSSLMHVMNRYCNDCDSYDCHQNDVTQHHTHLHPITL
jgi:hypothetical protein